MNVPPAPFVSLGAVPLAGPPSARWSPASDGRVITDLGGVAVYTGSEEQAAALAAAFTEAARMHAERGQS